MDNFYFYNIDFTTYSLNFHDNNIMEKSSNKLIKSKKYQGIYSKNITNDKMYYIAYKNSNGNYSRYKVGLKSSGITELYCYNLRNEEINKVRLNDNPKLSNKPTIIKFHEIAIDYFYYQELSQKSDWKNSKNKYLIHKLSNF